MSAPIAVTLIPERFAVSVDGRDIALTPTEYAVLAVLVTQGGRAFRRKELVELAIGTLVEERTVDTHVKAIRRKLGVVGPCLQTVRGIGYRWETEAEC
jgi:DNA-binding response OmpR family regulator